MNEALSMYVRSQDPSEMTEKQKRWNIRFSDMTEGCSKKKKWNCDIHKSIQI